MKKKFHKKDIEYIKTILKHGNYIALMAPNFWLNYNDNVFPYGRPMSDILKNHFKEFSVMRITDDNIYHLIGEYTKFRQATKEEIIQYHIQREHYELIPHLTEQVIFNEGCELSTLEEIQKPKTGTLIVKTNIDGSISTKKTEENDTN